MLPALLDTPRKIFPPPTTTATSMPSSCTCLISSATECATFTSMPEVCSPIKASPEIFRRTRRNAGTVLGWALILSGKLRDFVAKIVAAFLKAFTHFVTRETANRNFLAGLCDFLGDQLADGFLFFLDERLIQKHGLFIELVEAAFNDLVDHVVRFVPVLRIVFGLLARDLALFVQDGGRNLFARNITRLGRGDVHRDVLNQLVKLFAPCDEIRLAVYFDQHADLAAHVNVRADDAFSRHAALFLFCGRETALAQNFYPALLVTVGFDQSLLALHHAGVCFFSERLYGSRGNFCHDC